MWDTGIGAGDCWGLVGLLFDPAGLPDPCDGGLEPAELEGDLLPWAPLSVSCEGELDPAGEDPAGTASGGPWCPDPGIPTTTVFEGLNGPGATGAGTWVAGATHFVQIVEVVVLITVDTD